MIVVFLSYATNKLAAIFFALAETLSIVIGTGGLTLLALSHKSIRAFVSVGDLSLWIAFKLFSTVEFSSSFFIYL